MSLTEAQLAERKNGLGGSDAAASLGLSQWKSPLELFLEKREQNILIPSAAMRWGTILEPVIRQEYSNVTKRVVRMPPGTIHHAKHKFMLAHFDGITEDGRIFEAKTARSADGWGRPGSADVPVEYLLQVQHYMIVSGLKLADIAVLIGGSDFRVYEIEADPQMQEMMIDGESDFWEHVESARAPSPDFNTGNVSDLIARLYPGTNGQTITATQADAEFRRVYEQSKATAKAAEQTAEGAKAHLLYRMGDAARLVFANDGMQLTRKRVTRKGYTVEPSDYLDTRFSKLKETK